MDSTISTAMEKKGQIPAPLSKFMHPRNPYRTPPSFKKLATEYPKFREFCSYSIEGKVHLDFGNPAALRALTTSLLNRDFQLDVNLPPDRLVPTLPLRLNYILWLEDIISLAKSRCGLKSPVIGLDIGTGASAVYPLLGAKKNNWCMIGSEADQISADCAQQNVAKNNLEKNILIKKVKQESLYKDILEDNEIISFIKECKKISSMSKSTETTNNNLSSNKAVEPSTSMNDNNYLIEFTMCNPPFFSSEGETCSMSKTKRQRSKPSSAPTGSIHEKVVEGGEVAFISSMVEESRLFKHKIRLFSTLVGSKADLKLVLKVVTSIHPAHFSTTEFCQGRTMRWGVAWTFDPKLHLQNILSKKQQCNAKPQILTVPRSHVAVYTVPAIWKKITTWLSEIKIKPRMSKKTKYFVGSTIKAYKPLWLHRRRKRREDRATEDTVTNNDVESSTNQGLKRIEFPSPELGNEAKKIKLDLQPENGKTGDVNSEKNTGLPCLVKCKLHIKSVNGQINLELIYIGGSMGKEGANQIMTYIRNKLREGNKP